jgi:hypothetical protein
VLILTLAAFACRRTPSPQVRARQVGSWLAATSGVVSSWAAGSISPAAAESNLDSTSRTLGEVSREELPEPLAAKLKEAIRLVAEAREAVRAGDKNVAMTKSQALLALAQEMTAS